MFSFKECECKAHRRLYEIQAREELEERYRKRIKPAADYIPVLEEDDVVDFGDDLKRAEEVEIEPRELYSSTYLRVVREEEAITELIAGMIYQYITCTIL